MSHSQSLWRGRDKNKKKKIHREIKEKRKVLHQSERSILNVNNLLIIKKGVIWVILILYCSLFIWLIIDSVLLRILSCYIIINNNNYIYLTDHLYDRYPVIQQPTYGRESIHPEVKPEKVNTHSRKLISPLKSQSHCQVSRTRFY